MFLLGRALAMESGRTRVFSYISIALSLVLSIVVYKTYMYHVELRSIFNKVSKEQYKKSQEFKNQALIENSIDCDKSIVADKNVVRATGAHNAWRPIQEAVKDTVVQVFSQIAEFDFKQPYKTPKQYTSTGSGFFINKSGDIITNFHVVDQAKSIWIQVPSLGKRIIDVEVVGVSPDRDIALLRLTPESKLIVKKELEKMPYLVLGNSDLIRRSDEVMALGYPLGQQSLKSTTGVISGREGNLIQMSAAVNPGNSGGPLLNVNGEVVGINSAAIMSAQNVGYIIPVNELKVVLNDLYKVKLLRKPFLGVLFANGTESLTEYLGNPKPGGCYVTEVIENSTLQKAGVKRGDMIYEINRNKIDVYGDMTVDWSEDKISLVDYVARLSVGQDVNLLVYREGKRKDFTVKFGQGNLPAVHRVYPGFENIDYEVFAGMVVMELTMNHVQQFAKDAPGLLQYMEVKNQAQKALIITHIFPTSEVYRIRTLQPGATLNEINGVKVETLKDFRNAIAKVDSGMFTMLASDQVSRASDNVFVVLPFDKILHDEPILAADYRYDISKNVEQLIAQNMKKHVKPGVLGLEKSGKAGSAKVVA
jgi:Trypsin-like serine proteases, typically periplasmic, contain C-terminal PDZ domain